MKIAGSGFVQSGVCQFRFGILPASRMSQVLDIFCATALTQTESCFRVQTGVRENSSGVCKMWYAIVLINLFCCLTWTPLFDLG